MKNTRFIKSLLCVAFVGWTACMGADAASQRWFPTQKLPAQVYSTRENSPSNALRMLYQSLSGLAAKAVNEGKGDTMVWISRENPEGERWKAIFFKDNPQVKDLGNGLSTWALVDYFRKKGAVKGYILYRADTSSSALKAGDRAVDNSANIACSLAGVLDGIVVEESMEAAAQKAGLPLLADARDKTQAWCFETYKDRFNRKMMAVIDPRISGIRDVAIAQKCLTLFGYGEDAGDRTIVQAMQWLEPPAAILGWIGGDEFKATKLASIYGHFQTVSSMASNLPLLMAGSENRVLPQVPHLDPNGIDWKDDRSTVSFFMSDGDNAAWYVNSFFDSTPYYWSNPGRGKIPFTWTTPFAHLAQIAPQVIEYMLETRTPNDWMVEWHGGYYYPDLYASERGDRRWDILAEHARQTWAMMQKTGNRIIGFNARYWDSDDAKKAYQTFAEQTDGLLAMLVVQYSPYNAGGGEILWVKDKRGVEIPVISLRYQLWWRLNKRANSGTPLKVAREISETATQADVAKAPRNDWTMEHAWSYFQPGTPGDEDSQNMADPKKPKGGNAKRYEDQGGVRGLTPVLWCAEKLSPQVRVVSPEEMVWRIRMRHNPEQTRELMKDFK